MDRSSAANDNNVHYAKRVDTANTSDQVHINIHSPIRAKHVRHERGVYTPPELRQSSGDRSTGERRVEHIRKDFERQSERVQFNDHIRPYEQNKEYPDLSYNNRTSNDHQYSTHRKIPFDQAQYSSKSNYATNTIRQTIPANSRGAVVDINITVSVGGSRASRVSVDTNNAQLRTPARSTATYEGVRNFEVDFHSPNQTARLSTDGYQISPPK